MNRGAKFYSMLVVFAALDLSIAAYLGTEKLGLEVLILISFVTTWVGESP